MPQAVRDAADAKMNQGAYPALKWGDTDRAMENIF